MKKRKVPETATGGNETLDKINNLPDALLVQIISLLPLNDAVKTCLISKRWQYLWTSIDNLILVSTSPWKSDRRNFVSFVDYVISRLTSSKVRKFHLELQKMQHYSLFIEQWLRYAVKNKVEHVLLDSSHPVYLNHPGIYTLPQFFCTCSSLITLDLSRCVFDKGVVISWKSLKTLKICSVDLDDEEMVKLLSGCPALEAMELSCCYSFRRLEISKSSLKRLTLNCIWPAVEGGHRSMEIVAPYLQHLEISGVIEEVKCSLENVSSLVSAELTFCVICESANCPDYHHVIRLLVQDYLKKLIHVAELTIGTWIAEVLFMLQFDGVQLPQLKCKCLTVKSHITNYNLYGIASLLRASPHVETLNIVLEATEKYIRCHYDLGYFSKGDNIGLESWISNFVFPSLKCVKVICYTEMCEEDSHAKLFELLEFLLKNAVVLVKLVIIAKRSKGQHSKNVSPYMSQLAAKLSGCPRHSTNVMIIFQESDLID